MKIFYYSLFAEKEKKKARGILHTQQKKKVIFSLTMHFVIHLTKNVILLKSSVTFILPHFLTGKSGKCWSKKKNKQ